MNPVRYQRLHLHLAVSRRKLHPTPRFNPSLSRKRRRYFHECARRFFADTLRTISHIALVEMLKKSSIIQVQIILLIWLICRFRPDQWIKPGFPIREIEPLRIKQRLIASIRCHRPLQGLVAFKTLISYARHQWSQWRYLLIYLGRMLVIPFRPQAIGNLLNDSPVRSAVSERLKHLVKPLNAPLGTRESAFLLQARTRRQNNISKSAGLRKEDLLHHKKVQLGERVPDKISIRIHKAHLFAEDIHALQLAFVNRFDHQVIVEPRLGRQRNPPRLLELRAHIRVIDLLVAWVVVRHGTMVARTLHVVMPAQWIRARTGPHVITRYKQ